MKTTTAKKTFLVLSICFLMALVYVPSAWAFLVGENYNQGLLDPIRFYLVNDKSATNDDYVTWSLLPINIPDNWVVQYSYDGLNWLDYDGPETPYVPTTKLLYLQVGSEPSWLDYGNVTFISFEKTYLGLDLFENAFIDWGSGSFTLSVAGGNDNVAPVPIPTAALLFGSAMLCLVGIRRVTKG